MSMIEKHPYSFLFAGAGIVLLVIAAAAKNQSVSPDVQGPLVRVSGGNMLVNPGMVSAGNPAQMRDTAPAPTLVPDTKTIYIPPVIPAANNTSPQTKTTSTLPPATNPSTGADTSTSLAQSDSIIQEVYALLAMGGPAVPTATRQRTPDQQALFDYGNGAGLVVLGFANAHGDMAQVLTDWVTDRSNPSKSAAVNAIADGLTEAGRSLTALPHVPSMASSANSALAKGYTDSGDKLRAVVTAGASDTALIAAMKTYNSAADSFTASYIGLADIFSIYGVSFGNSDSGSAFAFPAASF